MLKVRFFILDSGDILGFDISGHSGYSESGSDIVCAAVSSVSYMTANTMTDIIGANVDISVEEDSGYMKAIVDRKDISLCRDILRGFKAHLLLLEEIYSENIKVSYAEV